LLDLPGLAERFRAWLADQPPRITLLVAGGGSLADEIRRAQQVHGFDDLAAHRLCLDVMGITARMVGQMLPEARFCQRAGEIDRGGCRLHVVDVREFLTAESRLPESWSVTSDSIAAELALQCEADELVLLKSALPTAIESVERLAAAGMVDDYFPGAARAFWSAASRRGQTHAGVRLVNLRDERFAGVTIPDTPAATSAGAVR
jgi:dihydroneopterin aldolase